MEIIYKKGDICPLYESYICSGDIANILCEKCDSGCKFINGASIYISDSYG